MKPRQLSLALVAEADPRIAAPPATSNALCSECQERPRYGRLSRCMTCVQAAAERARCDRAAAEARTKANTAAPAEAKAPAPAKSRKTAPKARKPASAETTAKEPRTRQTTGHACSATPAKRPMPSAVSSDSHPDKKPDVAPAKCCRSCKQSQPLAAFSKHRLSRDGFRHDCKSCVSEGRTKPPRELSPEQIERNKQLSRKPHRRRANRRAVKDWMGRNPAACHARKVLRRAVRKGLVTPAAECEAEGCHSTRHLEAHHANYGEPLEAAWLCARHHRRLHHGGSVALKPPRPQRLADIPDDLN
jgi:hypothetical protein